MKKIVILTVALLLILSCSHNDTKTDSVNNLKKEAMDVAIKYVSGKLKEPKKTIGADGIVTITENQVSFVIKDVNNNQIKYFIDPSKITVGLINDDEKPDAIVTLSSVVGQYAQMPENMILINTDNKLILNRAIEADMRIIEIKDRIITAEVLTHSRNSPLRDCSACKEVVKYQFKTGNLVELTEK
jgi:hypothetical protein